MSGDRWVDITCLEQLTDDECTADEVERYYVEHKRIRGVVIRLWRQKSRIKGERW